MLFIGATGAFASKWTRPAPRLQSQQGLTSQRCSEWERSYLWSERDLSCKCHRPATDQSKRTAHVGSGFKHQIESAFKLKRIAATIILVVALVMTFVAAFVLPTILCIIFVIVRSGPPRPTKSCGPS